MFLFLSHFEAFNMLFLRCILLCLFFFCLSVLFSCNDFVPHMSHYFCHFLGLLATLVQFAFKWMCKNSCSWVMRVLPHLGRLSCQSWTFPGLLTPPSPGDSAHQGSSMDLHPCNCCFQVQSSFFIISLFYRCGWEKRTYKTNLSVPFVIYCHPNLFLLSLLVVTGLVTNNVDMWGRIGGIEDHTGCSWNHRILRHIRNALSQEKWKWWQVFQSGHSFSGKTIILRSLADWNEWSDWLRFSFQKAGKLTESAVIGISFFIPQSRWMCVDLYGRELRRCK